MNTWLAKAEPLVVEAARSFVGEFTAEQLRLYVEPRAGEPPHRNHWGIAIRIAVNNGDLKACGFTLARRPAARGRVIRVYRCA